MPRPRGDHEARRRELSEAVWQALTKQGFAGLTLRAVAAEMGATTGLLTHYFPAKRDLVAYALNLLDRRNADRVRTVAAPGLPALRSALLDALPLTAQAAAANRIWVASWDTALADPSWNADHARRYADGRARLRALFSAAQELGELPPGDAADLAAAAQSFVLGLTVQALLDPAAFPADRQTALLDGFLAGLATGAESRRRNQSGVGYLAPGQTRPDAG